MNAQHRKLFVDRGSRQKLSQMGGIMASSSDLMGEAQRFAEGGVVKPEGEPLAIVAGRAFYLSADQQNVVDDQGEIVTDPMIMQSIMAQAMPAPGEDRSYQPPSMGATELNTPAMMAAMNLGSEGLNSSYSVPEIAPATADQITDKYEPPITAEMEQELEVLERQRTARDLSDSVGSGIGSFARNTNDSIKGILNHKIGQTNDTIRTGIELAGDTAADVALGAGYLTGGGNTSASLFDLSNSIKGATDNATAPGDYIPMFQGRDRPPSQAELLAEERRQISADSNSAIAAGEASLFAEGSVPEQLQELPPSIIQARNMPSPNIENSGGIPADLSGPEELMASTPIFNTPSSDLSIERRIPRGPSPVMINSEGVPETAAEIEAAVLNSRLGLENTQEVADRFPAEDALNEAQDDALSTIRTRQLSKNERTQMSMGSDTGTPMTVAEAEGVGSAPPGPSTIDGGPAGGADTASLLAEVDDAIKGNPDPKKRANVVSNLVNGTKGLSSKETAKAYEKRAQDMLGIEDKDESKEMWNNMAMIGFAIAAGESPNALSNIANGLLAGTKMMKEDRKDAAAAEADLTKTALAEANLDRRLAARLRSSEGIASRRGGGGGGVSNKDISTSYRLLAKSSLDSLIDMRGDFAEPLPPGLLQSSANVSAMQQLLRQQGQATVAASIVGQSNGEILTAAIARNASEDADIKADSY